MRLESALYDSIYATELVLFLNCQLSPFVLYPFLEREMGAAPFMESEAHQYLGIASHKEVVPERIRLDPSI